MNIEKVLNLYGLSEFSNEVKSFIASNNFEKSIDSFGLEKKYIHSEYTISLLFIPVNRFKYDYYTPNEIFTDSIGETFLVELYIGDDEGKPNFPFLLPFDLKMGESFATVKEKINARPSKMKQAFYGYYFEFSLPKFSVLTYFYNDELISVKIFLHDKQVLQSKKLQETIKFQSKNIVIDSEDALDSLKMDANPTTLWKQRLREGDACFSDKNIHETQLLLDKYIDGLKASVSKADAKGILNATKKLVKSINQLNDKMDCFIDTMEREELCDFIDKCLVTTGFQLEKGFDITEEWREW